MSGILVAHSEPVIHCQESCDCRNNEQGICAPQRLGSLGHKFVMLSPSPVDRLASRSCLHIHSRGGAPDRLPAATAHSHEPRSRITRPTLSPCRLAVQFTFSGHRCPVGRRRTREDRDQHSTGAASQRGSNAPPHSRTPKLAKRRKVKRPPTEVTGGVRGPARRDRTRTSVPHCPCRLSLSLPAGLSLPCQWLGHHERVAVGRPDDP